MTNRDGILIVNKEQGMTSHDVVGKLRRVYHMKKIGHTGTLDPLAEGVMVVCFGRGTKLSPYLTNEDKVYEVEMCFGLSTDTEDITGEILENTHLTIDDQEKISENIEAVLTSFVGKTTQIPPMYSAIKVDGKKLYQYARKNEVVEVPERTIEIKSLELMSDIILKDNKVFVSLRAHVSKGTYIRTLCIDIAKKMGYIATMTKLTRVASGDYKIENSVKLKDVEANIPSLIELKDITFSLPTTYVEKEVADKLKIGYKLPHYFVETHFDDEFIVKCKETNELIGIFKQDHKHNDKYRSVRII